jgi:hypothetical protein
MRKLVLAVLAPLALVACGDDDRPVVINTPPAATVTPAPAPSTVLVPVQPQQPAVVIDRR